MTIKNQKGFTLIELLVVISIIALLSSITITSLDGAKVKARNSVRIQGASALIKAFQVGMAGGESLPSSGSSPNSYVCVAKLCYDGWDISQGYYYNSAVDAFLQPNLPTYPSDPVGGNRGYAGFVYVNSSHNVYDNDGDGDFDDDGAYIDWLLEKPANSCGPGKVYIGYNRFPNYVDCFYKLD